MKNQKIILLLMFSVLIFSCSNDDSAKVKVHLLKKVDVTYPTSSLSNYSLDIVYNNDNTINTVVKTRANNTTFRFVCSYSNSKKLKAVEIESPTGSTRTIEFQYTPQDILFQIKEHIDSNTNTYEINYDSVENNYSSANKTWLFNNVNNFEGYYFLSEFFHTFSYNNAKGIENLEQYLPLLIYETLKGIVLFATDLNLLSSNQVTSSTFEELSPGGITINYNYSNVLNADGLLETTTTYVTDDATIVSTKTYTYETKFQ
jgi:hypothetical protein